MAESPSILREMADVVLDPIYALEDHGSPFQKWVEEVFQRTREHLANYSLSLRPAPDGSEFLLGDCPAVGIAPGMNPRRRPPLFDAKALILPLSPGVAAMAYPSDRGEPEYSVDDADDGVVLAINHGQIAQSHKRVFFRPDSGHSATVRNYLGI
ncbi:DUF4238 domain-containing protein [Arthrobacter cryoconiti]|uniref:DUF4238 domain-containing protein n=1 Tax=Arthrobacter cryoconiti TaxID=748907 RepID=A0ABV8R4D1_9MICC|nr:DUF4238 domain-containing protein [Arthrobacter cryoconiti]